MSNDNKRRRRRRGRGREGAQGSGGARKLTPELRQKIEEWALEAADAHGLRLFEVEPTVRGRWIIRVYVERLGEIGQGEGITVDECAEVSRYMEAYLDAEDGVPDNYVLEVSSPGLERPLKKPRHVEQAVGEQVELVVREQIDGKNKVVADLVSFDGDTMELRVDGLEEPVEIGWEDVAKARLKHDF